MGNRRQHTIPYFHFKRFLNPGVVYRRGNKSPHRVKTPKNVAVRIDYYRRSPAESDALDKINRATENWAAPVLKKLIDDVTAITHSDWGILSYYFANIHVRTPAFEDSMINTFKEMTKQLNKMGEDMKRAYEKAIAEGKDLSLFNSPSFNDSPRTSADEWNEWMERLEEKEGRLDTMSVFYSLIKDVAECIQRMTFHICEAPGGLFFTTTDRPLVLLSLMSGSSLGAGWGNKDVLVALPLDPKHLLVMGYRGEPAIYHTILSANAVHSWNVELMKYAVYEVYSKHVYDVALDWMLRKGIWKIKKAG